MTTGPKGNKRKNSRKARAQFSVTIHQLTSPAKVHNCIPTSKATEENQQS